MPNKPVSLTTFVDFVLKSGLPKVTVVKNHKKQLEHEYELFEDFYKPLRARIRKIHREDLPIDGLDDLLTEIKPAKQTAYQAAIAGYKGFFKKFAKKAKVEWLSPQPAVWSGGGIEVRVNPELAFRRDGMSHIIKLYMKEEALTKNRTEIIGYMMSEALNPPDASFGVLDIRRGKYFGGAASAEHSLLLAAEANSFGQILASLTNAA